MRQGRFAAASASALAAVLALLIAVLTPATHGTFSAEVDTATGTALNPWFGCTSMAASIGTRALFAYGLGGAEGDATAPDLSGSGHPGSYSAPAHFGQDSWMPCRRDGGGVWMPGGTTDLVTQPLPLPTNFAYETWFRSAAGNRVLMSIEVRGYGSASLVIDGSGGLLLSGLGTEFLRASATAADDRWHHLVMDAGNGSLSFWLDGTMLASNSLNVPDGVGAYFHIGSSTDSGAAPFDGQLRFAALYTSVLTPTEIAQHRAAGRAGPVPSASATPSSAPTGSATAVPGPTASATATAAPDQPSADPAATAAPTATPAAQPAAGGVAAAPGDPDISTTGEQAPTG